MAYKKWPAAVVSVAVVASALTACGGSSQAGGGGKQFTLWSMWSEGEPNQKLMAAAIADFQQSTGIHVNVKWKGRNPVKALQPALNTDNVPADLVDSNNAELVNTLATTGDAEDLSKVYDVTVPDESRTVGATVGSAYRELATPVGGKAPVMVPYQVSTTAFFYNGKRFPDLAKAAPVKWDDLQKVLDTQKAQGTKPLALDGSIPSYSMYYLNMFTLALGGDSAWVDAIRDKTGNTWKQPAYLEAAKRVQALAGGGYFSAGYDASKFPAQQQKWASDKADFIFGGTWLPRETAPYAADGFQYRSFAFPAVGAKPAPPLTVSLIGFAIPAKAKQKENAEKFVSFFLQKKYQEKVASEAEEIPVSADVAAAPEVADVKKVLDTGRVQKLRAGPEFSDFQTKVLFALDDQLVFGKIDAATFIEKISAQTAEYWKAHG
ncbi:hypothetical protein GCM10009804_70820 [Kribbella hippodromi]|uniref:Carbohydrate ABC transporter substrate-binding protein (CUT1 family) n=1 Tax=Kribbella hippodromi TaxID=434347 RepID=A0ABN2EDJ7_9ACTN